MGHILSFIVNRTLDEANHGIQFVLKPSHGPRGQPVLRLLAIQADAGVEDVDAAVEAVLTLTAEQRRVFVQELFQGQVFLKNTLSTALGTFTSQALEGRLGSIVGG